jgi:CBS domain containing-hemolysin-like protein
MDNTFFIWLGISLCLIQAGIFSGLNLAMFMQPRLRLEVESASGNASAAKILALRSDSNLLLTTILWGNVGVNVLLTLLSGSVLTGVAAFMFSTVGITLIGEIVPQAYFSRHAMRLGAAFTPLLVFYKYLLYPVTKPSAIILDAWIGKEGIEYYKERTLRNILRKHIESGRSEIEYLEGVGALNFLSLDDMSVMNIGEEIDPAAVISLDYCEGRFQVPEYNSERDDPFLKVINKSGRKWVILTDSTGIPVMVLNAHEFLRHALFDNNNSDIFLKYCHKPIMVTDENMTIGDVIPKMKFSSDSDESLTIKYNIILVWTGRHRIITGSDILSYLFKGVLSNDRLIEST